MNYFESFELNNSANELNDFYANFFLINEPFNDNLFNEQESIEYKALFGDDIVQNPYSSDSSLEINSSSPDPFFSSSSQEESDVNLSSPISEEREGQASLTLEIDPCSSVEIDPYSPMLWPTYIHPQADTLAVPASSTKRAWEPEEDEEQDVSRLHKKPMLSWRLEESPKTNFHSYAFSQVNTIQGKYQNLRCGIEKALASLSEEMAILKQEYQQICHNFLIKAQFPPKPEGITEDLMPYQWLGYKWMELLSKHGIGGCLADDMGLGKTMQSIALIQAVVNEKNSRGEKARILVSCPAKLIENWKKEFRVKSAALSSSLHVIEGNENIPAEASICLVSHEKLRLESKQANSPLYAQNWDLTICDEFHSFLGSSISQKAILDLRQHSRGFIGLTGTPMPNGLIELYKLNYLLNPNLYPKEKAFITQCLKPAKEELKKLLKVKQQLGEVPGNYPVQNLEEHLVQLIDLLAKPFILRRLKSQAEFSEQMEVMQRSHDNMSPLPPLQPEIEVPYEFSHFQAELIDAIMKDKNVEEEEKLNEQGVLSLFQTSTKKKTEDDEAFDMTDFLCLRQIADHPSILSDKLITRIAALDINLAGRIKQLPDEGEEIDKTKAISDVVQQILKNNPQDKILIFTNFEGMGTRVCEALKKSDLNSTMKKTEFIFGKIPKAQREKKIAFFQSEEGSSVMVLGRQVGSVGLNITRANHVIIVDPWWNFNNDDQCIGRAYRIGQKKSVYVYRLHQPGFVVDEKMTRVCVEKKTWSDLILSQDSNQVSQLIGQLVSAKTA